MRLIIEPKLLERLLKGSLVVKGGKPLIENVTAEFGENSVKVRDISLEILAVHNVYARGYFLEYQGGNEKITLAPSLLAPLGYGFKNEEKIIFNSTDKLRLQGQRETYEEPLLETKGGEFPLKMVTKEQGIIPEKISDPTVLVLVNTEELTRLPSADKYHFVCDGERLTVHIENVGKYSKCLPLRRSLKAGELRSSFDGEFVGGIVGNLLGGDVWLSITPDVMAFSQKFKDCAITYVLSAIEV